MNNTSQNNAVKADIILHSHNLFTASPRGKMAGYVIIKGDKIIAVAPSSTDITPWMDGQTQCYSLGSRLVCPGFQDNHTFFTGYLSMHRGVDLSLTVSSAAALALLEQSAAALAPGQDLYAWGWSRDRWPERSPQPAALDNAFPDRPVIAIDRAKSYCWMNQAAMEKYGFMPENCSAEARARLLNAMLADRVRVRQELVAFMQQLARRGVTTIKDIGFDDAVDLLAVYREMADAGLLRTRLNLVSQPVLAPMNLRHGLDCRRELTGSLEEGKLADIAVFDRDLYDCTADNIRQASVILTLVNGRVVYDGRAEN